jgi:hypothetical protein
MLLYSAIDGMAWCVRQNLTGDVTEEDFEKWVEIYVLEGPKAGDVTAVDLYAARCAMLHSQIAESRKSKNAIAREVHYIGDDGAGLAPVFGLNTPTMPVFVNIDWLFAVFDEGIARFRRAIDADPEVRQRVEESAAKYLLGVRFGVPSISDGDVGGTGS